MLALAVTAGIAAAAVLLHPLLLGALGRLLVVAEQPVPSDAIVVLGGDWQGRIQKGIQLFKQGYAPVLVVTGGMLIAPARTQADYLAEVAQRAGVPPQAIVKEGRPSSTWQDAVLTVDEARRRGWKRVLVVTSDWHSRRAAMVFRRVYGKAGIEVRSVPSAEWRFDTYRWWEYPEGGEAILSEWLRLAWYWIRARP